MKFYQDLCETCDMNSTLGSVVPLAMFFYPYLSIQRSLCIKTMSGHQPLFFNIQINFCEDQNIYTKGSIQTCLLSYLPEIDIEISTKPAFLNLETEAINNFCCSTLYFFTEYLSLIALLRLFCCFCLT